MFTCSHGSCTGLRQQRRKQTHHRNLSEASSTELNTLCRSQSLIISIHRGLYLTKAGNLRAPSKPKVSDRKEEEAEREAADPLPAARESRACCPDLLRRPLPRHRQ
jgi:hypothetical protein